MSSTSRYYCSHCRLNVIHGFPLDVLVFMNGMPPSANVTVQNFFHDAHTGRTDSMLGDSLFEFVLSCPVDRLFTLHLNAVSPPCFHLRYPIHNTRKQPWSSLVLETYVVNDHRVSQYYISHDMEKDLEAKGESPPVRSDTTEGYIDFPRAPTAMGRFIDSFKRNPNARVTPEVVDSDGKALADQPPAEPALAMKLKPRHLQMIAIGGSIGTIRLQEDFGHR